MENRKLYIGLGVLAVAGIGYYMWKKNNEISTEEKSESKTSEVQGGGEVQPCVTTCESTPNAGNPNVTVYAGECPPVLANQPTAGYKTITRCGGVTRSVPLRGSLPVRMSYSTYR
jgi:hypothetical protein